MHYKDKNDVIHIRKMKFMGKICKDVIESNSDSKTVKVRSEEFDYNIILKLYL